MKKMNLLFLVLLLTLLGCQRITIPTGKYKNMNGEEYIIVKSSKMFFHLRTKNQPELFIDKEYGYTVYVKDGIIIPKGMSSVEYFLGISNYDLNWNGRNILVKPQKPKTAELIVLERVKDP